MSPALVIPSDIICESAPTSLKSPCSYPTNTACRPNDEGIHAYRPPNGVDRSPCPALNTLANHSYLPHNGRDISFSKIVTALQEGMGLSHGFAIFMAIGTYTLLRRPSLSLLDLQSTARHNYIEHDASMVHDDTPAGEEYAPIKINLELLHNFLLSAHPSKSSDGLFVITADDIARRRIEREAECRPLDALHAELGRAEFAMVLEIFGKGKDCEVAREDMKIFLEEERFPPEWKPTQVLHLWEVVGRSTEIRKTMGKLKEAGGHIEEGKEGWLDHAVTWLKSAVENITQHTPEAMGRDRVHGAV